MKALFLNCTIKDGSETSNTQALCEDVAAVYERGHDVETEIVRLSDYSIPPGISSDEGNDDEWPEVLEKIKQAEIIIVATPIWLGEIASPSQRLFERLEGTYAEGDEKTGQYPLYNKVAGAVVTGTEDGGHACAKTILFNLSRFGCTIPAGADCYWVGHAGPGPSYIEAEGERHLYTNRTKRTMAANTVFLAEQLQETPYTTNLHEIEAEAKEESRTSDEIDWRSS